MTPDRLTPEELAEGARLRDAARQADAALKEALKHGTPSGEEFSRACDSDGDFAAWQERHIGALLATAGREVLLRARIAELEAALSAAEKDARRYRWLFPDDPWTSPTARVNSVYRKWDGQSDWDAAIDAALAEQERQP